MTTTMKTLERPAGRSPFTACDKPRSLLNRRTAGPAHGLPKMRRYRKSLDRTEAEQRRINDAPRGRHPCLPNEDKRRLPAIVDVKERAVVPETESAASYDPLSCWTAC